MSAVILETIAQAKRTLIGRRDELLSELKPVEEEIRRLDAAEYALSGTKHGTPRGPRGGRRESSIQGQCLKAVLAVPGMNAAEIQGWISVHLKRDITRTSLAPQLSRLCDGGRLKNQSGQYYPATHPQPGGEHA